MTEVTEITGDLCIKTIFPYPPFRKVDLHHPLRSIKYLHLNLFLALSRRMRFVQIKLKAPDLCKKRMKMETTTTSDSSSLSDIVCTMRVTAAIDIRRARSIARSSWSCGVVRSMAEMERMASEDGKRHSFTHSEVGSNRTKLSGEGKCVSILPGGTVSPVA